MKKFTFDEAEHGKEIRFKLQIWDQNGTEDTREDDVLIDKLQTENLFDALRSKVEKGQSLHQEFELNEQGVLAFTLTFVPKVRIQNTEEKEQDKISQKQHISKVNNVSPERRHV